MRKRLIAMALALYGCAEDGPTVVACTDPVIDHTAVAAVETNVLAAVMTVHASGADSFAVRFGPANGPLDSVSAVVTADEDEVPIPILGLLPSQAYTMQAVAWGCSTVDGVEQSFTTQALPSDLPSYHAGGPNPSPGYVVFGAAGYGLVIDNTGRVVWYHRFPNGPGLNFQAQPNGLYVARPPSPDPNAGFIEIDVLGNVGRTLGCKGWPARFHDLIVEPSGGYWVMCDETRPMDLTLWGGRADAMVMATEVQRFDSEGQLIFAWSPFEHFSIDDLPLADRTGAQVNWTHGNAIDLDPQGNLLISFRSLSEVTNVAIPTGQVMWRMGGHANQFEFIGTDMPAFTAQHGLRSTGPGRVVLLDNLGQPGESRAERYQIDPVNRTVRMEASIAPTVPTIALLGGTTQNLPGGRVLVSYGNGARVEEYDATGRMVWQIQGNSGYVFRAQRIQSLYRPGVGTAR